MEDGSGFWHAANKPSAKVMTIHKYSMYDSSLDYRFFFSLVAIGNNSLILLFQLVSLCFHMDARHGR